ALKRLWKALAGKTEEFDDVVKIGRTHLQEATPVRRGKEFSAYARQIELGMQRVEPVRASLGELALGGTAVGTGLNTHPEFAKRVIALLARETRCPLQEAKNHFEAQAAQDALVEASGALRTVAVSLMKIANDIRWLGPGPRNGKLRRSLCGGPQSQPRAVPGQYRAKPGHVHGARAGNRVRCGRRDRQGGVSDRQDGPPGRAGEEGPAGGAPRPPLGSLAHDRTGPARR